MKDGRIRAGGYRNCIWRGRMRWKAIGLRRERRIRIFSRCGKMPIPDCRCSRRPKRSTRSYSKRSAEIPIEATLSSGGYDGHGEAVVAFGADGLQRGGVETWFACERIKKLSGSLNVLV